MKKIIKNITILFMIFTFLFSTFCFAETDFKKQVKDEEGSLFEKIIAECIGRNCTNSI